MKYLTATFIAALITAGSAQAVDRFVVQERTVPDYKTVAATFTTRDTGEARAVDRMTYRTKTGER